VLTLDRAASGAIAVNPRLFQLKLAGCPGTEL